MHGPVTVALGFLAFLSNVVLAAPIPQTTPAAGVVLNGTSVTIGPANTTSSAVNSTATAVNSTATSMDIPSSSGSKVVVAHFMVGNAYSHTVDTWKTDISMAQSAHIDGFALNVGSDSWQPARVADAYTAAKQLGNFKLFMSFDMTVLPGSGAGDADLLRTYISQYYDHPNQMKVDGKSLVSTFSGENSFFGQGSVQSGWAYVFSAVGAVEFLPSFFLPPATIAGLDVTNGGLAWNSAWNTGTTTAAYGSQPAEAAVLAITDSFSGDLDFINEFDKAGKSYMAAVSPSFFTHYGADTYNKNWLYNEDYSGYSHRWDAIISNRDKTNFVEIITWNDYGESSYVGPIGADQPNSQAWVDGFDHTSVLPLTAYYVQAFKNGAYPDVAKDQVFLAARPHTHDANASSDGVGKPTNWETVADNLFVDVLCTAPSTVVLATSDGNSKTFQVQAGASQLSMPLTVGGYIEATIQRNGATVVTCKPDGYTFTDSPKTYNYNFFMASC
ncbi:hypothetical protein FRB95_003474 [Tulasnella sp. JGI-2019a]|nr:hypothetical protein FRB93_002534 [Tulasnella sp. JGI-2019a]KAG9030851.1 hypothetical protein FRB95_003474 [Tulasnella sp. JGI-2019a]